MQGGGAVNIFFLDRDPTSAARYHCDKHCVKMILEYAQLMSTAHEGAPGVYRPTHRNHPCSVWVRESRAHYVWLYALWTALLEEYSARYCRTHASSNLQDLLEHPPGSLGESRWLRDPPQAMPEEYQQEDTVSAYRAYCKGAKASFARWSHSPQPHWWNE